MKHGPVWHLDNVLAEMVAAFAESFLRAKAARIERLQAHQLPTKVVTTSSELESIR